MGCSSSQSLNNLSIVIDTVESKDEKDKRELEEKKLYGNIIHFDTSKYEESPDFHPGWIPFPTDFKFRTSLSLHSVQFVKIHKFYNSVYDFYSKSKATVMDKKYGFLMAEVKLPKNFGLLMIDENTEQNEVFTVTGRGWQHINLYSRNMLKIAYLIDSSYNCRAVIKSQYVFIDSRNRRDIWCHRDHVIRYEHDNILASFYDTCHKLKQEFSILPTEEKKLNTDEHTLALNKWWMPHAWLLKQYSIMLARYRNSKNTKYQHDLDEEYKTLLELYRDTVEKYIPKDKRKRLNIHHPKKLKSIFDAMFIGEPIDEYNSDDEKESASKSSTE